MGAKQKSWFPGTVLPVEVKRTVWGNMYDLIRNNWSYHRKNGIIVHNKSIGAAPGCDYYLICVVAKRMVRTTINLVGTLHIVRCTL